MHWENVYRHILKEGDNCLDIGANEGLHSLIMKKIVGPKGKVYAFEPQPNQFMLLSEKKKDGIFSINEAMKDFEGSTEIYYSDEDGASNKYGGSTTVKELVPFLTISLKSKNIKNVSVNCTTISAFCERENLIPDFIKIDTEGAETEIIRGGLAVIKNHKPNILFEYGSTNEKPHPESVDILEDCGYNFFIATLGIKNGVRIKKEPTKFIGLQKSQLENMAPALCDILAIHNQKMHVPGHSITAPFDNYFKFRRNLHWLFPFMRR
ncbi:MAG: FkbM family methyltransferase [Deltaproteobacteria bacterium]|nr:FkbM family methyltransferase [Deltaproteobacteria bacterium]